MWCHWNFPNTGNHHVKPRGSRDWRFWNDQRRTVCQSGNQSRVQKLQEEDGTQKKKFTKGKQLPLRYEPSYWEKRWIASYYYVHWDTNTFEQQEQNLVADKEAIGAWDWSFMITQWYRCTMKPALVHTSFQSTTPRLSPTSCPHRCWLRF